MVDITLNLSLTLKNVARIAYLHENMHILFTNTKIPPWEKKHNVTNNT